MTTCRYLITQIALIMPLLALPSVTGAQEVEDQRIEQIEDELDTLSRKIADHGDDGVVLFLCGSFSALWAQQTGRNAWLWFFAGAFFNVITLLVLLYKNSEDRPRPH